MILYYFECFCVVALFILISRFLVVSRKAKKSPIFILVINQLIRCLLKNIGYIIQSIDKEKYIFFNGNDYGEYLCNIQLLILVSMSSSIDFWVNLITLSVYFLIIDVNNYIIKFPYSYLICDLPGIILSIIILALDLKEKNTYNCWVKEGTNFIVVLFYSMRYLNLIINTILMILILHKFWGKKNILFVNEVSPEESSSFYTTSNNKKVKKKFIFSLLVFPVVGIIGIIFPILYNLMNSNVISLFFILSSLITSLLYPIGLGIFNGIFNGIFKCSKNELNQSEDIEGSFEINDK